MRLLNVYSDGTSTCEMAEQPRHERFRAHTPARENIAVKGESWILRYHAMRMSRVSR